jgi:hypothetical protein
MKGRGGFNMIEILWSETQKHSDKTRKSIVEIS